jgi:predicted transcriptional regulator
MSKETITFRLDSEKRKSLDEIAVLLDRDRSYVLNEAINAYLEIHSWQLEHIKEGLRQSDAGEFASPEEVAAKFAKWRK